MSQKRKGEFFVLYEYHIDYLDEQKDFEKLMKKNEFARVKTIEGNKFSIPFQDIWINPEKTHLVHFIHNFIVDSNYVRINGSSDDKPKSILELGSCFSSYYDETELSTIVLEAIEEENEEEQVQAIINFAIGFYHYDSRYPSLFEEYLKLPSVKVRLATIRAIGFQLWNECTPLLKNLISSDPNPAVRAYATETLRQIQQPDFDPDDLYENPSNYPDSLENVTEQGLMKLPQIKDDLQAWMKKQGYSVMDALVLYQYLKEIEAK